MKKSKVSADFDWDRIREAQVKHKAEEYRYRCSTKCDRESENPPLTYSGNGMIQRYRTDKGKMRWMFSFLKRSERDDMILDCKIMNGRKARKEFNR